MLSDAPGQGDVLLERRRLQQRRNRRLLWTRLLLIRFPGVDPSGFMDWLYPRCRWLLGGWGVALVVPLLIYALTIVSGQVGEVRSRLPSLATLVEPANLLLLLITLAAVKVLHELGHALLAHHVGGHCREMGLQLLAFTPCLYCDVSDIWKIPRKWSRIAVSAAGMGVELVLAAGAIIVWWHTQPGLINTLALNTAIVCSLGTILFNGNPLLRYDGYFVLSDLVGIPNLWEQSREALRRFASRWVLGTSMPQGHRPSLTRRAGLVAYALTSNVYLLVVLLAIFATVLGALAPHGLSFVAYGVGLSMLGTIAVGPLGHGSRFVRDPIRQAEMRPFRAIVGLTAVALAVAALLLWPLPYYVAAPAVLAPETSKTVYATVPGKLVRVATAGTTLAAGDTVAVFENSPMLIERERLHGNRDRLQQRLQDLVALQGIDPEAATKIPTQRAMMEDATQQLEEVDRDLDRLVVRAPTAGTVIPPPRRFPPPSSTALVRWSGTPLDESNLGAWLRPGEVICSVGDPTGVVADVSIRGADVELVAVGQAVKIAVTQLPGEVLMGEVVELAERGRDRLESKQAASALAEPRQQAAPPRYLARVRFTSAPNQLVLGTTCHVKIQTAPLTLARRAWRFFKQTLRM